jgi:hypothetical protein
MPVKFATATKQKKARQETKFIENKSNENKSIEKKSNDTNDDGVEKDIGFQILSMTFQNKLKTSNGTVKIDEDVIDLSFGSSGSDIMNAEDDGSNIKRLNLETVKRNEKMRC